MASINTLVGAVKPAISPMILPDNCVFYAFDPEQSLAYPPSDMFVVIQPGNMKVVERVKTSAGMASLWTLNVSLWIFVRQSLDEAHRETAYLTDLVTGSIALVDRIVDAFQTYRLNDNGNTFGYELDRVVWNTKDRSSTGWASTRLDYHTDITGRAP